MSGYCEDCGNTLCVCAVESIDVDTLQARADSLERIVRVLVEGASIEDDSIDINCDFVWAARMFPGDFDRLRSLITPEGGE